ncbi:MAG: hypothetical protein ACYDBB_10470 [Armatimonadota bacterium]
MKIIQIDVALINPGNIAGAKQRDSSSRFPWLSLGWFPRPSGDITETPISLLSEQEEAEVQYLLSSRTSWLEQVYLTLPPGDLRPFIRNQLHAIDEYGDPDEVERQLCALFSYCRQWHERQSDTPV